MCPPRTNGWSDGPAGRRAAAALTLLVSGRHGNAAAAASAAAAAWRLCIEAITSRLIRAAFARLAARACRPV